MHARHVQEHRQKCANGQLPSAAIDVHCAMDAQATKLLSKVIEFERISARSIQKIRRIARTCADLAESDLIREEHIGEAFQYRLRSMGR